MRAHGSRLFVAAIVALACAASACGAKVTVDLTGGSTGGGAGGSGGSGCNVVVATTSGPSVHVCFANLPASTAMATCAMAMGTLVSACPTANELGSCAIVKTDQSLTEIIYSDGGGTAAAAAMECSAASGTWTPAGG